MVEVYALDDTEIYEALQGFSDDELDIIKRWNDRIRIILDRKE